MFSTGPFDRYQMCECDILKTNESILLQISKALHAARHKTINFRGWGQGSLGHRRPKLDLQSWRRRHSQCTWAEYNFLVIWMQSATTCIWRVMAVVGCSGGRSDVLCTVNGSRHHVHHSSVRSIDHRRSSIVRARPGKKWWPLLTPRPISPLPAPLMTSTINNEKL